jgi:hypothetical protein
MVVASGAAAWGVWRQLTRIGAWPGEATTRPELAVLTFWCVGFAVASLVAAVFERWARRAGAWAGCWIAWALLACGAAWYMPEASHLLVAPALVAGVVGIGSVVTGRQAAPGLLAAAVPLLAAAVIWLPPAWFLFDALGPVTLPVSATAVAVLCTAMLPLVAGAGRLRWQLPLVVLVVSGVLALAATRTPAFSAERPERMNVTFFQLEGDAEARWAVSPQSGSLPAAMRRAASFGTSLVRPFPWSTFAGAFVAPAPRIDALAPEAALVGTEARDGTRLVRLRVTSRRGAREVMLWLPRDRVVSAAIGGRTIPDRTPLEQARRGSRAGPTGYRGYACLTLPPGGVEFEVVVTGAEPVDGFLADQSEGLPPGGDALLRARPVEATAIRSGDVTILGRRVSL